MKIVIEGLISCSDLKLSVVSSSGMLIILLTPNSSVDGSMWFVFLLYWKSHNFQGLPQREAP